MGIVIDTNVLVSALLWHGAPHALLKKARMHKIKLVPSTILIDKFSDVTHRLKFANRLNRANRTPVQILRELQQLADVIVALPLPQPVCCDPDDDAVLTCALAAQVDCVVSGDADLLTMKSFMGMPIISPADAAANARRNGLVILSRKNMHR